MNNIPMTPERALGRETDGLGDIGQVMVRCLAMMRMQHNRPCKTSKWAKSRWSTSVSPEPSVEKKKKKKKTNLSIYFYF